MNEPIPKTMTAVMLAAHGGLDVLEYRRDVPVPAPGAGEVLIRVAAAGVNATDINTRIGWYSTKARRAAGTRPEDVEGIDTEHAAWSGIPMAFPRIQGADCCGLIVAAGANVDPDRIGERVIVRPMLRSYVDYRPFECWTLGSDCDGAFAQFVKAPSRETYAVECDWSDAELGAVPCAFSTAENMLHRASLGAEHVLVTGASGGVGSAAVRLAKRRGAFVAAVARQGKAAQVRASGADIVVHRGDDLVESFGEKTFDVVVDVVGGAALPTLLNVLRVGGRYATAGAIGGPSVQLDLRTLYLKDLTLFGCTFQDDVVFENLTSYIHREEIRPGAIKTFALHEIAKAQTEFLAKEFVGKLVLVPPH